LARPDLVGAGGSALVLDAHVRADPAGPLPRRLRSPVGVHPLRADRLDPWGMAPACPAQRACRAGQGDDLEVRVSQRPCADGVDQRAPPAAAVRARRLRWAAGIPRSVRTTRDAAAS